MCLNFSSYVCEMKKQTRACVYPRVTQLCPKTWEETWWLTQLSNNAQNTCAIGLCCRHHHNAQCIHTNIRLVFGQYGGYNSSSCVFQCPQQVPKSQHSQGYKTQSCYACMLCAPEFGTFSTLATALLLILEDVKMTRRENMNCEKLLNWNGDNS